MKIRIEITAVTEFEVEEGEDPNERLAEELADFKEDPRDYTTLDTETITYTAKGEIIA